jgi:hypothetical protein
MELLASSLLPGVLLGGVPELFIFEMMWTKSNTPQVVFCAAKLGLTGAQAVA